MLNIRYQNKCKLVRFIQVERNEPNFMTNFDFKTTMFDGCLKRISESAR